MAWGLWMRNPGARRGALAARAVGWHLKSALPPAALWIAVLAASSLPAQEPLHQRIDRLVEQNHVGTLAPPATDGDFLRRAYLDFAGRVPSLEEVRAFLADGGSEKRAALIDRLLGSTEFIWRMTDVFDVMLMERRAERVVKNDQWREYLFESLSANKPLDLLAREILSADGVERPGGPPRAAVRFYLDRDADVYALARDVGRMFFGRDMQCAQCHDHPLIDDYLQSDYYGLVAFLNRSYAFADKQKTEFFAEKADGDITFQSVFTKTSGQTAPRLPGGDPLVEPKFASGEDYLVAPSKTDGGVPKHSRRGLLAVLATGGQSRAFNRNLANRLWAIVMGRGLVEPVDLDHTGNPPSNPELLELLTDELPALKYDLRRFLREVALSQAYGRAIEMPPDVPAQIARAAEKLPQLEGDEAAAKSAVAQIAPAAEQAKAQASAARGAIVPIVAQKEEADKGIDAAQKAAEAAGKAVAGIQSDLTAKQEAVKALGEAAARGAEAAAKLPDDKELAQAAEKFKAKGEAVSSEVAAAQKSLEEKTAAAKAAGDALGTARQAADEIAKKLDDIRSEAIAAGKRETAETVALRVRDDAASAIRARIAEAQLLVEYGNLQKGVEAQRIAAEAAERELAVARAAVAAIAAENARLDQTLASAKQAVQTTAAELADLQKMAADKKAAAAALAEALAQSELAAKTLSGDAELAEAIDTLKKKFAQATANWEAEKGGVDQKAKAAQAQQGDVAAIEASLSAGAASLASAGAKVGEYAHRQAQSAESLAASREKCQAVLTELARTYASKNAVAVLRPLTPEQLAWSMMQVTGVVDRQREAAAAEWARTRPDVEVAQLEAYWASDRLRQIERETHRQLQGSVAAFVNMFAAGAGQPQSDFFATADQALFLANGGMLRSWLAPAGDNLPARLQKQSDDRAFADELYLAVLTRNPSDAEAADVASYLAARQADRPAAVQELIWGLMTSVEFRFIH